MLASSVGFADTALASSKGSTDLGQLDLEDLLNIEVTSVSKKAEKLSQTASAVYVITQDDIRRSGATSVMEALRGVPGLQVARLNSSTWAISARGFNQELANKMLVLVDGRSVYDTLYSGVFWLTQDMLLEDIDRIEIIRGPGATVWGANAVNGVIDIITKSAAVTQGVIASASLGTGERTIDRFRYGGELGAKGHYRVYGLYTDRDSQVDSAGNDAQDAWQSYHSGFRIDLDRSESSSTTIQGDIYDARAKQLLTSVTLTPPFVTPILVNNKDVGGNLLARWNHMDTNGSASTLQSYYSRADRHVFGGRELCNTWDLDFQRRLAGLGKHDVVWGLGYRLVSDTTTAGIPGEVVPTHRADNLLSAFVQDEISLMPDKLHFIVGSKVEHNGYTGLEVQPSGRLLWTPNPRQTAWASVSRAVRTPSRIESDGDFRMSAFPAPAGGTVPEGTPVLIAVVGNKNLSAEDLLAYEAGYRTQPMDNLSLDVAVFYNKYTHLIVFEPETPFFAVSPAPPHLVVPMRYANDQRGSTYGIEVASNWDITRKWRVRLGYSTLRMRLVSFDGSHQGNGLNPKHQAFLRSSLDLGSNLEFDTIVTRTASINNTPTSDAVIPAYTRVDLVLNWRRSPKQAISLVLQNLTSARHLEMFPTAASATEVERSCYVKMTWSL